MRLTKRFLVCRLGIINMVYKGLVLFINCQKKVIFFTNQLPTFQISGFKGFEASNPYFHILIGNCDESFINQNWSH